MHGLLAMARLIRRKTCTNIMSMKPTMFYYDIPATPRIMNRVIARISLVEMD